MYMPPMFVVSERLQICREASCCAWILVPEQQPLNEHLQDYSGRLSTLEKECFRYDQSDLRSGELTLLAERFHRPEKVTTTQWSL